MSISAKIIEDSLFKGSRLTTWELRFPRFIHSELMTHRMASRSASSSRAIPVEKFVAWVQEDPAEPVEWGANNPGMQSKSLLNPEVAAEARRIWLDARDVAVTFTKALSRLGVHKQISNRALETWQHITVLFTCTDECFANLMSLRCHGDAQPEFRELAKLMLRVYVENVPVSRDSGEWHVPYLRADERKSLSFDEQIKCAVARCARVSYNNHDGSAPSVEKDLLLYDRLVGSAPLHASPAEHIAQASESGVADHMVSNFGKHWLQYRKLLKEEYITKIPDHCWEVAGVVKPEGWQW